jgi:hypothetical protein
MFKEVSRVLAVVMSKELSRVLPVACVLHDCPSIGTLHDCPCLLRVYVLVWFLKIVNDAPEPLIVLV